MTDRAICSLEAATQSTPLDKTLTSATGRVGAAGRTAAVDHGIFVAR